jgi:hypothetical protein
MSNYTKSTNFATKDALTSGDPLKIVKGTEINTEFDNIATAVNSKSDTASPTFTGTVTIPTLSVSGTAAITGVATLTANPVLSAGTANGVTYLNGSKSLTSGSALTFDGTNFSTTGTASASKLIPTGTSVTGNGLYLPAANALGLSTNGTNAVYIDSSQNVGIGTTTNNVYDAVAAGRPLVVQKSDTSTTLNGSTAAITIANSDTTTNNTAQLNFAAITGASASQYSSAIISCIFGARTNAQYPTGQLVFSTSTTLNVLPTEKMRIDSSGNLLVGKTSTTYTTVGVRISPTGLSQFTTSATGITNIQCTAPVSEGQIAFYRQDTGGLMGTITNGASNTVSYATSSDYRLKENITPMTGALSKVAQLKPVTYKWKNDGSDGQGFIAHELQEIVPDCVSGIKDAVDADGNPKYQGVDTSFLVATLTAAIQEQQALITALTARITALENK